MSAVDQSTQTSFGIKPPVIKMFGVDYRVTIGYRPTMLSDDVFYGRIVEPTLTVTLERV
ncbi:hypothetical protein VPH1254_0051 [Vibrio phage 1254]|nr:hypothetical protein SIPHO018v1_150001 [Vibrio phage 11E33.1]QZI86738.1 hypothetical protein SIPHO019v1_170002 [Vibrio phage 82E32.1]QZI92550.1 hypothetical protein SIPHO017v1_p0017 [Vibrio phage 19E33.1]QZI92839.1 hypothetical protein SIPHO016v1_p0060 [Vibrio phage 38E33.6a]QZI92965.1 hypothetical protein SIPHO015v1_p0027 [Vibrio phage 82E32.2]QZI93016.1 hypothetical protein SIPHO014v1_p0017 [Vibrio phage 82E32.3]QZI93063.1 hypothetical protein SIPHO013v1_p0002 [Vibrio phage 82E33.2]